MMSMTRKVGDETIGRSLKGVEEVEKLGYLRNERKSSLDQCVVSVGEVAGLFSYMENLVFDQRLSRSCTTSC
jgi:hypothetical protein